MLKRIISVVICVITVFSVIPAVFAAELSWPYANSDAMPFRPSDNYHSMQNPPHFSWPYVDNAISYEVIVATDEGMKNIVYSKDGIEKNVYNFPYTFETKIIYYWSVRYKASSGVSEWSTPSRFIIDENAFEFPVPEDILDISEKLEGRARPYNNIDFSGIEKLGIYSILIDYVEGVMKEPVPGADAVKREVLDPKLPNTEELYKLWNNTVRDIMHLAIAYKASGEKKYFERIVETVDAVSGWDPAESFEFNQYTDTTEGMVAFNAAVIYDWLYNDFNEETRDKLLKFILNCIKRPKANWVDGKFWGGYKFSLYKTPHDSHSWKMNELTVASLLIYNESEEAREVASFHLPLMINYGVYNAEEDGSSTAGPFYGMHAGRSQLYSVMANMGIFDIIDSAFYQNKAYTYLYLWPPGWINNIGDSYNTRTSDDMNAIIEVQTNIVDSDNPVMKSVNMWQLGKINGGKTDNVFRNSSFAAVINNKTVNGIKAVPPVMLPNAKYFKDSGWIGMFSSLSDDNKVGMIFHSSPQGSHNHSHPDQNSFVIQAYGENLAIDSDYYDSYSSFFDLSYNKKTYAHNTITYNEGVGQPAYTSSAKGHITDFLNGSDMVLAGGDASEAYAGLSKADRKIIYIRPETFIVIDDLEDSDDSGASFEWWLNAEGDMKLYNDGRGALVSKGKAEMDVKFHWPEKLEANYINYFAGPDLIKIEPPAMASTATDKRMYFATGKKTKEKIISTIDVHRASSGRKYIASEKGDGFLKLMFEDGTDAYIRNNDECIISSDGYETDALALVIKDETRMMVSGTYVKYNGTEIIKSDVTTSVRMGNGELSVSSIDNDAEIRVYLPEKTTFTLIENEKSYGVEKGVDYGTCCITAEGEYTNIRIYNGQYYFYLDGKPLPGSTAENCKLTVEIDGKSFEHQFDGLYCADGSIFYEYDASELSGVYSLKEVKGVSLKDTDKNSLQLIDSSSVFTVTEKEAYISLESIDAGENTEVVYYEDNNTDYGTAAAVKKAVEYDRINTSPTIKHWSSLGYATLQDVNDTGESATWVLEVEESGNYDIIMSYSTVSGTVPGRIFRLGDRYGLLTLKATDVYSNLDGMRIKLSQYLEKGTHELELIAYGGGIAIFDWIGLKKSDL